ncbi:MAG: alginate export family protein [Elusimicrobia bacterium]|nr:alginate export family protein [Elusimicrobiota bacterium]
MKTFQMAVLVGLCGAGFARAQTAGAGASPARPAPRFGGQLRARGETASPLSYATPGALRASEFGILRTRLSVDAVPAMGVRVFAQLQDSRTAGTEASTASNEKNVDLHQGYVDLPDLWGKPLLLRIGRQELAYGDGRLVSPLDWSAVGRAWDGVKLAASPEGWAADVFVTKLKETGGLKRDTLFSGLYVSYRGLRGHELDAYAFSRDQGDGTLVGESGRKGNLSERTVGSRLKGKAGRADYSAEAAWQFGRQAGDAVRAYAGAATAGYTFDAAWKPRLGVEATYASGDKDPGDARRGTFDPLFPFGHMYQGFQDLFGWKNGEDWSVTGRVQPGGTWELRADYHAFRLAQARDGWYDAATAQTRRDATGSSGRDVGHEADLTAKLVVREAVKLWFGVSRFWNSSFVKRSGGGGDRNWAFLQATVDF